MMISRHFHDDRLSFLWWLFESLMITKWNFYDGRSIFYQERSKCLWWQAQIFTMTGWDFFNRDCNRGGLVSMLFSVITFLTQHNVPFYVCLKSIALCNYRSRCCSSATLVQNIGEFGAKKLITEHRTAKTFTISRPQALRLWNIFEFLTFLDFLINDV